MFYLMTHSTHFIYGIWCWTHGKEPLGEKRNLSPLHRLLFPVSTRDLLYALSHQDSTYHSLFTPVVQHWLEQDILAGTRYSSMGPPLRIDLTTYQTLNGHSSTVRVLHRRHN